ncbi:MAG TPA: TPM domain-containing protein [Pyrinomonadaceae bacterium]|nr:TPM domain-containing protein [Pyrinomonadaceae bacterium]
MKLSNPSKWILLASVIVGFVLLGTSTQFAQTQLPARTGYVNDFAGVVDEKTKLQLTGLLENVQQKTGIEFAIVTVPSTAGRDIFQFSRQVANDWNVGARTTKSKSLLLVLAVDAKESFTQFSRSVQSDLPEAVLGEMSQRMKALINAGDFAGGLNAGVHHFVNSMAQKLALNPADFETSSSGSAAANDSRPAEETVAAKPPPSARSVRPRIAAAPPVPTPTPVEEPVETKPDPVVTRTDPVETKTDPAESSPPVSTPTNDPVTIEASTKVRAPAEETAAKTRTEESPAVTTRVTTPAPRTERAATTRKSVTTPEEDADESEEVELTLTLPLEARINKLKEFLRDYPDSKSRPRAIELLVSAHAGLGDQRLKKGDGPGGIEQLMLAISSAPVDMSEKLFSGVVAQIPLNLYLRGEREAAARAAQSIETRFGTDAKRLVALSGYYINTEQADEAVRIATQAVSLAPDSSQTHQALGLALHISLRLDEAVAEYKKSLELEPDSKAARRGLADLNRGLGKSEEALALYRGLLANDPVDRGAQTGLVLSLLDLGRMDEAKKELDAALKSEPKNLSLLSGAAYWFAAHNDLTQAEAMGRRALEIEPRYTWSHVAMARTFVAQRKPLNAERALRFARQYGKFPTLEYELANALAAAGLFGEASEVLAETFTWKDGQIETRLAGRSLAQGKTFSELLAPERRASIFQSTAAESESNAKMLRDLLVFTILINRDKEGGTLHEPSVTAAAKEFASGSDPSQVHRQLYAASRLLQKGIGFSTAHELAEAARSTADAGLTVPEVTLAVQADEYRDSRARAIAAGGTPNIEEAPRNILSNLLRGRIEDISGWALFNQDKLEESVDHLKRAANILPGKTPAWRSAQWHLGAALHRVNRKEEALSSYIKSYSVGDPDPARRTVIERLYRDVHGSLAGLDEQIGAAAAAPVTTGGETSSVENQPVPSPAPPSSQATSPAAPQVTEPSGPTTPEPKPDSTSSAVAPKTAPANPGSPESAIVESINKPRASVATIKGRVTDSSNNPIANVVVVLISPQGSVLASTTDSSGNYSFTVAPSSNNYRVIPSKDGFSFEPADRVLSGVREDLTGMNFVGAPKSTP